MTEAYTEHYSTDNKVHAYQEKLKTKFGGAELFGDTLESSAGHCLQPFLIAAEWRGQYWNISEALPHFDHVTDLSSLRVVLANLSYPTKQKRLTLNQVSKDMLPCLYEMANGDLLVLIARDETGFEVFDGQINDYTHIDSSSERGNAFVIDTVQHQQERDYIQRHGWGNAFLGKMKKMIWQLLCISFLINVFALAIPIFVMNIYDKAIGTGSGFLIVSFFAGILIVLAADGFLRVIRARALAYIGARWEALVGTSAFQQLLYLPLGMTERSPVSAQLVRLRQFDGIRDMFTGQVGAALLDLPFLIVFLAVIFAIAGSVGWVPVTLIAIYAVIGFVSYPMVKSRVAESGEARNGTTGFLTEMVSMHGTLRESSAQDEWMDRYIKTASKSVIADFKYQQLNHWLQTISQALTTLSGVATLGIGAFLVMDGSMSTGALIATMALIWRVLGPLQTLYLSASTLNQGLRSLQQVNQLMKTNLEQQPEVLPSFERQFKGKILIDRVSFRYKPEAEPALVGAALDIQPGELVAIAGTNGSGKSTLLKIVNRLYIPQSGAVLCDGLDLRQFDARELRRSISYLPQEVHLFHGSVKQNMRLADPSATDQRIETCLAKVGLNSFISSLENGSDTILSTAVRNSLPDGISQRLGIARALLKDTSIYLMDEPANNLDDEGDALLMDILTELRGNSTVIMVTARPSHMRLADTVAYLHRGQIVQQGKPDDMVPLILNAA